MMKLGRRPLPLKISQYGVDLIKEFEGLRLEAYKCPAGVLTIGYGHTGADVYPNMRIDQAKADALLAQDIEQFEEDVNFLVRVPLAQPQFDALVSFAYNLGSVALGGSTLLKKLNAGDYKGAGGEFDRWVYADGVKLKGLVRRREAEQRMFLKGTTGAPAAV